MALLIQLKNIYKLDLNWTSSLTFNRGDEDCLSVCRSVSTSAHSMVDSASDSHARKLSIDLSKFCRELIAELSALPRLMMLEEEMVDQ